MPTVSSKRQITLPIAECKELGIEPGDEVEILRHGNHINIIKKKPGRAAGMLQGIKAKKGISDEESRQSAMK